MTQLLAAETYGRTTEFVYLGRAGAVSEGEEDVVGSCEAEVVRPDRSRGMLEFKFPVKFIVAASDVATQLEIGHPTEALHSSIPGTDLDPSMRLNKLILSWDSYSLCLEAGTHDRHTAQC